MSELPDGVYDVIVIEAEQGDDGDLEIEVAVTLGPRRGDVIRLRGRQVEGGAPAVRPVDPSSALGIPGTLRVRGGQPHFRPER
jgi:hypothetical protein